MKVKILIKGLALCYADENFWNVFFICDDTHPLNFLQHAAGSFPFPATLRKKGKNRRINFNIGNSRVTPPERGAGFESIFNLAADYAHEKNKLKGKKGQKTEVVWMKIPSATLDTEKLTERRYFVQEAKVGHPVQIIHRVACSIKAEFEVTDTNGLTISLEDDEEKLGTTFPDNGENLILEFDNDCRENCKDENDFILYYDWLEDKVNKNKKFVAGQIKNSESDVSDEKQKSGIFLDVLPIASIEHGNCDPATVHPPPDPPIEP